MDYTPIYFEGEFSMAVRSNFDIPVNGINERYMPMDELLRAFRSCKTSDPEMARTMAEYACDCGNIHAKLEYSGFLRVTPQLAMSQEERYSTAERLLEELLSLLDVSNQFEAEVALELGTLYADYLHRPIGALSLYLHAQRLGATVEDYKLKELQRKMEKMDINQLGSNSVDAFRLGKELHYAGGAPKLAELFLREAVDKASEEMSAGRRGAKNLYGQACLGLRDFYDELIVECAAHERMVYRAERDRLYAEAKAIYPEYLGRN